MAEPDGSNRVPTWRDGVVLSREEKTQLTAEQWRQYSDESVVRDLPEIDQMPEPMRSWAQAAVGQARAHAAARIAEQEHREAS
jgi:hypothetical protein